MMASRAARAGPPKSKAPPVAAERPLPYDQLKRAIVTGELLPGQPLVESTLATWCGVSRTPIREALRRLEQDGLVERDDHGLAVRARSPEEIIDLYDTRIALEAMAGRVAAERRSDHDVRTLRWMLERGERISTSEPEEMVEANQQFHRAVWKASRNESLIDLLERLSLHLGRYPQTTLTAPGRWADAIEEHRALADAIERRDADDAEAVATRHFQSARDIRLQLFATEAPAR
jgi:DNA-binding GntR family transcriptional regulator